VSRFVQTEVEYIIYVIRSVFDLLQEMIAGHWDRIELLDKSVKKQKLPKSFADVLLHKETLRTSEEITKRYGLPKPFADWYVENAKFFMFIRTLRNRLAHSGHSPIEALFCTERGFAIFRKERHWCELYDWPKEVELPNELVPLRPVLCTMVWAIVAATDTFAQILTKTIVLPGELFPGLRYFSRGYHDHEFIKMDKVLEHSWWCDTNEEADSQTVGKQST
jgi:hypothetical protein